MSALLSFRGASVQSALDEFFSRLGTQGAGVLVSDRALARARSKLHAPALWALNDRLIHTVQSQGRPHIVKGRRLVCADGTLLAPAQRACLRTRSLAAPVQRSLGLYLPGNDLMLHVAVGPQAEGERQMLFDQIDRLRRGDVLILDRGYPASWLVQAMAQRGIDFWFAATAHRVGALHAISCEVATATADAGSRPAMRSRRWTGSWTGPRACMLVWCVMSAPAGTPGSW